MTNIEQFYKKIYVWFLAMHAALCPMIIGIELKGILLFINIFTILAFANIVLYYTTMLLKTLPGRAPLSALLAGIILVAGGSIIDMMVTIICSPDLALEGNPMVLTLLNNKISLPVIYFFMLSYQILKTSITILLWISFLKIYPNMLTSIPYINFFTTMKWLFGLVKMRFDFFVSSMSVILVITYFFRWYIAMEWLGWVPMAPPSFISGFGFIFFGILIFTGITHLHLQYRNEKSVDIPIS